MQFAFSLLLLHLFLLSLLLACLLAFFIFGTSPFQLFSCSVIDGLQFTYIKLRLGCHNSCGTAKAAAAAAASTVAAAAEAADAAAAAAAGAAAAAE